MRTSVGAIMLSLMLASPTFAANYSIDSRIDAMGGAGTVAGDYLSAGFHNPALAALDPHSNFGILLPALGGELRDPDDMIDGLEDLTDAYDASNSSAIRSGLINLQGDQAFVDAGLGMAIGLPTNSVSGTMFAKVYTEANVTADIRQSDIDTPTANPTSNATVLSFAVGEVGVALATNVSIAGQRIALGVTPKFQRYLTYNYGVGVDSFDTDDWDDSRHRIEESAFNIDLGAVWANGPFRVGLAAKNMISQDIETVRSSVTGNKYVYEMEPLYTLGVAYVSGLFTVSADLDLNEKNGFSGDTQINDNSQFFRIGAEIDVFGQAQVRAGYRVDMEDNVDNALTVGLGLSPFGVVNIDLAAAIMESNSYGGSAQLAFTF